MRKLLLGTAFGLIASASAAQDLALVMGTSIYEDLRNVTLGTGASSQSDHLERAGFDVITTVGASASVAHRALTGFLREAPDAERIVVVLSGRFVTDGTRTWYLTADADEADYFNLGRTEISVDSLMHVMSSARRPAVLMLATPRSDDRAHDTWLREGVGTLNIPQGVTVLQGTPQAVTQFMADELVEPGAELARSVAADDGITAQGTVPRRLVVVGEARPRGIIVTDPDGQQVRVPNQAAADERNFWNRTRSQDTIVQYRRYLDQYPRGSFASDARARIAAIVAEPGRVARLAEEALGLDRTQRRGIQRSLNVLNYNTRGVDGIFGSGTRNALTNWQQQQGFPQTGYVSRNIARVIGLV